MTLAKWSSLPILDLARLQAGPDEKKAFLHELRETAHDLGFFYVSGHGVDEALTRQMLTLARRFFDLPEQDKLAIEMVNSPHFRGYTRAGMERTRGQPDWREQIDIGAEKPALPPEQIVQPWWRLQGPNQWPAALPELRDVALRYQAAVTDLTIRLVKAFAVALGQDESVFEQIYTPLPQQLIKIIRYPGRDETEGDQGVGAHKDGGFVTVLLQDVQAGLQVNYADAWIGAPPLPGTFVVNIGELLELASNGYLRATVHRVVTPPAGRIGFPSRSSLVRGWMRRFPYCNFHPILRQTNAAYPKTRTTHCFAKLGATNSRAVCARIPMWRADIMPTWLMRLQSHKISRKDAKPPRDEIFAT